MVNDAPISGHSIKPKKPSQWEVSLSLEAEERFAAQWHGYTYEAFKQLPGIPRWREPFGRDDQSTVLVMYRAAMKIEQIKWADNG